MTWEVAAFVRWVAVLGGVILVSTSDRPAMTAWVTLVVLACLSTAWVLSLVLDHLWPVSLLRLLVRSE